MNVLYKQLLIDARCAATGIGVLAANLLTGLKECNHECVVHAITTPQFYSKINSYCDRIVVTRCPIYSLREQLLVPYYARGASLLHSLNYNVPIMHRGPVLVTVHDLTHITDPVYRRMWQSWVYAQPMLRMACRRSEHILTVSQYTRDRLVADLGVSVSKISVIPNGVSAQFRPRGRAASLARVRRTTGIDAPFLLFVGNLKPHKNVRSLITAIHLLKARGKLEHLLVIVGDDPAGKPELEKLVNSLMLSKDVTFLPSVPEELLIDLYCTSDLFVLPSFEEGFGLPVLEAMATATPVICSQSASLPEVGGDAVKYFDPHDPAQLAETILEVLGSADLQAQMRSKGLSRSKQFTWDACVKKHLEIYNRYL